MAYNKLSKLRLLHLVEMLKVKAEEDDRSLSQYINRVLRKMLINKEEKD